MTTKISSEDCEKILRSHLQTFNDIKFTSYELKSFSGDVVGFLGDHFKLIINYKERDEEKSQMFFVKNKPIKNDDQTNIVDSLGVYKKEIFIYDVLFKEFEKYGFDTSFAPKCYHSSPDELLVMEDISLKGYSLTDKHLHFTVDHIKCVLKSLAMYHAAGFALERKKSEELNRKFILGEEFSEYFFENFFVQYIDPARFAMNWWKTCEKTMNIMIDLLTQSEAYKQEFKELIKNAENGKSFASDTKISKTCGHGDLWSNNMLFKYQNGIPTKCIVVDFQLCRYFYPAFDVLMAIFTNTDSELRKSHLNELYSFYHKSLSDILQSYGYEVEDIHSLKDFHDSIKLIEVEALMHNFLCRIIVFLPKQTVNTLVGQETGVREVLIENAKLAAEAFQSDVTYRNVICEALFDLREALIRGRK